MQKISIRAAAVSLAAMLILTGCGSNTATTLPMPDGASPVVTDSSSETAQVASSVLWPVAPLACGRRLGGAAETPPPASLRARYVSRGRAEEVTDSAGDYASLSACYVSRGHYTPPGSPENLFLACALRARGKPHFRHFAPGAYVPACALRARGKR